MGSIVAMLQIIRGETDERLWVLRPDSSIAAYLEDDAVVATGRARSLPRSTWYEDGTWGPSRRNSAPKPISIGSAPVVLDPLAAVGRRASTPPETRPGV